MILATCRIWRTFLNCTSPLVLPQGALLYNRRYHSITACSKWIILALKNYIQFQSTLKKKKKKQPTQATVHGTWIQNVVELLFPTISDWLVCCRPPRTANVNGASCHKMTLFSYRLAQRGKKRYSITSCILQSETVVRSAATQREAPGFTRQRHLWVNSHDLSGV